MEEITQLNAKHHCRICLINMLAMVHRSCPTVIWYHVQQTAQLKDWLQELTPLRTLDEEKYPQYVCAECFGVLKRFHEFRELVRRTATQLDELFIENGHHEIKVETHMDYLETEDIQEQSDPLQYFDEVDGEGLEASKFNIEFEAEATALTLPTLQHSDYQIRLAKQPKIYSAEILANISNGIYTISEKTDPKSQIWNVFGKVKQRDGTVLDKIVYCRSCCQLLTYAAKQLSNLVRHHCYKISRNKCKITDSSRLRKSNRIIKTTTIAKNNVETNEEILHKISTGLYKITKKDTGKSRIWKVFGRVQTNDGVLFENIAYCRVCSKLLKCNAKHISNLVRHNCYKISKLNERSSNAKLEHDSENTEENITLNSDEDGIDADSICFSEPGTSELNEIQNERLKAKTTYFKDANTDPATENFSFEHQDGGDTHSLLLHSDDIKNNVETHGEILNKISVGLYKITDNEKGKSRIWNVFGRVQNINKTFIENVLYCRLCHKLMKYNGKQTSNLLRHNQNCYKLSKLNKTNENVYQDSNEDIVYKNSLDEEYVDANAVCITEPATSELNVTHNEIFTDHATDKLINLNVQVVQNKSSGVYKMSARTTETEDTTLKQPTLQHSDYEIRHAKQPKMYSAEILANISNGIYKICGKTDPKIRIWNVFGKVKQRDGTVLDKVVYCRSCCQLLTYKSRQLSNLVRHRCYKIYKNAYRNKCKIIDSRRLKINNRFMKTTITKYSVETRGEILDKILTGLYKITEKDTGKSRIWKVFGRVQKSDATLFESIAYCRLCCKLMKYNEQQTSNLVRHNCYKISKQTDTNAKLQQDGNEEIAEKNILTLDEEDVDADSFCVLEPTTGELNQTHIERFKAETTNFKDVDTDRATDKLLDTYEDVVKKIFTGVYKISERTNARSRIWTLFGEVQKDDGNIIENFVYCRTCNRLLKYNGRRTSNLMRHKCYMAAMLKKPNIVDRHYLGQTVAVPVNEKLSQTETKEDVLNKISSGLYKVSEKHTSKLHKDPGEINRTPSREIKAAYKEEAGSTTTEIDANNDEDLDTHLTLDTVTGEFMETYEQVLKKISAGLYHISDKTNPKSQIWKVFGEVTKTDTGTIINSIVYCRSCCRLLKYNGKQTSNLVRHKCYASVLKKRKICRRKLHLFNKSYLTQTVPVSGKGKVLETETYEEVHNKILAETYKIADKPNTKSRIWLVFGEIEKSDGTKIKNFVYCRTCQKLMKYNGKQTSNLVKHFCYAHKVSKNVDQSENDVLKEGFGTGELIETHEEVLDKISVGIYKLSERRNNENPIWTVFREVMRSDATIMENIAYCSYCCQLRIWNGKDTLGLVGHKCKTAKENKTSLEEKKDVEETEALTALLDPVTGELNETYRQVLDKISAGTYKIIDHTNGKSGIWTLFGEVKKDDGTLMGSVVYCRSCCQLMKFNRKQTSNLLRHRCYISKLNGSDIIARSKFQKTRHNKYIKQITNVPTKPKSSEQESHEEVLNKMSNGVYKLTEKKGRSLTWTVFKKLQKNDGTMVENIVYCTMCSKLMKCNGKQTSNLIRHKCYVTKARGDVLPPTHKVDPFTGELVETYEEVHKKISNGVYKIAGQTKKGRIWKMFGQIESDDSTIIPNIVYCRLCCQLLKYNKNNNMSNLIRHKCYKTEQQESEDAIETNESG